MKYLIIPALALTLTACKGGDAKSSKTEMPAVETSVTQPIAPKTEVAKSLPLPPFRDYGPMKTTLAETDQGSIIYPIKSPYDFNRVLSGYDDLPVHAGTGDLFLPSGASADKPVPAMVILHGSGGITEGREYEYAQLFANNGIAGFVVDYYEPRGVTEDTPYVMKTMITTEVDIISDAYSALNILATHPAINAEKIGVTGYSYGGMATRYVMDDRLKEIMAPDAPPFALHMDIYGPCHQTLGYTGTTGAPYLAIHGDNDNSVDPALCQEVYKDLETGGSTVESHVMPGAGHAWENYAQQTTFDGGFVDGCKFSFDPKDGTFLVDGKSGRFQPTPDMNREERAYVRSTLGELAGSCVGQGYIVGNDAETDAKSKAIQLAFMKRVFGL